MVDTRVGSGKVRHKNARLLVGARHMGQGSRFNFEDVVRHLPGRDASLRWMYTSHAVPLNPRQIAEMRILQSQLHSVNGRNASGDLTNVHFC